MVAEQCVDRRHLGVVAVRLVESRHDRRIAVSSKDWKVTDFNLKIVIYILHPRKYFTSFCKFEFFCEIYSEKCIFYRCTTRWVGCSFAGDGIQIFEHPDESLQLPLHIDDGKLIVFMCIST